MGGGWTGQSRLFLAVAIFWPPWHRSPALSSPNPEAAATQAVRGMVRKVVLAVLFAALVFAGLAVYSDVNALRETARGFRLGAFGLGLGLAAGNYLLRIVRWQYYLRLLGIRIPLGESSAVFLSSFVMSVTPGKVGEVFKSLLLYEARGISFARTAPIVVAERLTDLIALVLLTALGSLAFENGILVACAGAVLVSGLILVCSYRPLGEWCLRIAAKLPVLGKLAPKLREAYDSLLEMTRPAPMLLGTLVAFVAWAMECGSLYAIVHGFEGAHISWDGATFAYASSTILGAVAMMPGGLGVTELTLTGVLHMIGGDAIPTPVATAATILVRIATLWFAVAIGVVALAAHRAMQAGKPQAA
jgi:uncharacterized protein (TIRG00374 family)